MKRLEKILKEMEIKYTIVGHKVHLEDGPTIIEDFEHRYNYRQGIHLFDTDSHGLEDALYVADRDGFGVIWIHSYEFLNAN